MYTFTLIVRKIKKSWTIPRFFVRIKSTIIINTYFYARNNSNTRKWTNNTRKASNRKDVERKVKLNPNHAPYIKKAIEYFKNKNVNATYKQIQKQAFEFYKKEQESKLKKYEGIFDLKLSKEEALKVIEDEEILYDD